MALTLARAGMWAAVILASACGSKPDETANGAPHAMANANPGAVPQKPACPRTGHWSDCQLFTRLEQAGVAPRREGTAPDLPPLGATPRIYTVGNAALAVYLFADSSARAHAARSLDTLHFIAPSASLTMRGEATAIGNDNLLALLFSKNDQQRERVSDAILAGAPR